MGLIMERVVYLSGPMSGLTDYNYPAFDAAARELRARGFTVITPSENKPPVPKPTWHDYMEMARAQVPTVDMIVTLPGWRNSQGAIEEVYLARAHRIEIVDYEMLITTNITWPLANQTHEAAA